MQCHLNPTKSYVGVEGLGCRVWGLGFGVWGLGFGFGVWGLGLGFGVWGLGFLGFGVWGFWGPKHRGPFFGFLGLGKLREPYGVVGGAREPGSTYPLKLPKP